MEENSALLIGSVGLKDQSRSKAMKNVKLGYYIILDAQNVVAPLTEIPAKDSSFNPIHGDPLCLWKNVKIHSIRYSSGHNYMCDRVVSAFLMTMNDVDNDIFFLLTKVIA